MATVQKGAATLYGVGTSCSVTGYASALLQDGKLDHKFKLTAVEDEKGCDASLVAQNEHYEVTVTFVPLAAGCTISGTTPLATVALAGFGCGDLNGNWYYVGDGSVNLSQASGKISLKLRRYIDNSNLTAA
jgi:hypothetical protein